MSENREGYIYVLENPGFPGLVKIGMTTKDSVQSRVNNFATGAPTPFLVSYSAQVKNPREVERKLHVFFEKDRVNKNREFFSVSVQDVIEAIWKFNKEIEYKDKRYKAIEIYLDSRDRIKKKTII